MSKVVKPITMNLSVMDTLIIIEAIDHLIKDEEVNALDRMGAEMFRKKVIKAVEESSVDLDLEG